MSKPEKGTNKTGLESCIVIGRALLFQNDDLKKQLHDLQAKITALSEKQVFQHAVLTPVFHTALHMTTDALNCTSK